MNEIDFPGTFEQALSSDLILPGSRLLLRAGTYSADYINQLSDVTIQPYPGEHVIIDGSLLVRGSGVTFRDLEIAFSGWTTRASSQIGSHPTDIPDKQLRIIAPCKFVNCMIHDLSQVGL